MTLPQAEKWLGMRVTARGRGLKRILENIEKNTGKQIIIRAGGKARGVRYCVTRSSLRRHCRHMVPSKVDELRDKFGQFLKEIDERIENTVAEHVAELIEPQLDELWERDETTAEAVRKLSVRVERLAKAVQKSG